MTLPNAEPLVGKYSIYHRAIEIERKCYHTVWTFEEFRKLMAAAEAGSPEGVRTTLRIEFDPYDDANRGDFVILRDESDSERTARLQQEAEYRARTRAAHEENERRELERLKAKYEGGGQ